MSLQRLHLPVSTYTAGSGDANENVNMEHMPNAVCIPHI